MGWEGGTGRVTVVLEWRGVVLAKSVVLPLSVLCEVMSKLKKRCVCLSVCLSGDLLLVLGGGHSGVNLLCR